MPTITPSTNESQQTCPPQSCWRTPEVFGFAVAAIILTAIAGYGFYTSGIALNTKLIFPLTASALAGGCLLGLAHHVFKNKNFAHAGTMTACLGLSLLCVGATALLGAHIVNLDQSAITGFSLAAAGFGLISLCFYSMSLEKKREKAIVDTPKEHSKVTSAVEAIPLISVEEAQAIYNALFAQDDDGNTPLHRAVIHKDQDEYRYWIQIANAFDCVEQIRSIPNRDGMTIQPRPRS
jgi:hypothetical protein